MRRLIAFRCGACNARIKAPFQLRGQTRACPGCGHPFIVRAASPRDADAVLVSDDQPTYRQPQLRRA
jgi:predicted RNA-binding Zn-ribbon protein involved in translation (DUF1610 family)